MTTFSLPATILVYSYAALSAALAIEVIRQLYEYGIDSIIDLFVSLFFVLFYGGIAVGLVLLVREAGK